MSRTRRRDEPTLVAPREGTLGQSVQRVARADTVTLNEGSTGKKERMGKLWVMRIIEWKPLVDRFQRDVMVVIDSSVNWLSRGDDGVECGCSMVLGNRPFLP